MYCRIQLTSLLSALLIWGGAAAAQGPSGGPSGPGPVPSPWIVNGSTISYNNGGITVPSSVSGGTKGVGTINANEYYRQGVLLSSLPCSNCAVKNATNIFTASQTFSLNSGTLPVAIAGTVIRAANVNSTATRIVAEGYGSIGAITIARAEGTAASPTQVLSGTQLGGFNSFAWGSNAAWNGPVASLRVYAGESITSTAWGSKICLATASLGSSTATDGLCQNPSSGITLGSPTGGDKGASTLNTVGTIYINNVPVLTGNQTITLSGDVTGSGATSITTVLGNIPTGTPAAGSILFTNTAAPSPPAAGKVLVYTDTTDLRLHDKNAAGVVGTTVVADTGASNNFLTSISAAGTVGKAQPSFGNLSGSATCGQLPALSGDVSSTAGSCVTTLATVTSASGGLVGSASVIPLVQIDAKGRITNYTTASVVAPAGTLTGATLASNVLASSLTSVGTLTGGATGAGFTLALGSSTVTGVLASANGGTGVNNGSSNLTLGGSVTHAGAFSQTITATATTNSTLPAGTHTLAGLDVAQTWSALQGFNDNDLGINGSTSGNLILRAAAVSGASVLRFPAGSTDFSATGGSGQYVKQSSSGAALTVAAILAADLPLGSTSAFGAVKCDGSTITCSSGVITAVGAAATSIDSGGAITSITNGTSQSILYNSGGFLSKIAVVNSAVLSTNGSGVPSLSTTLPAFTLGGAITGNSQNITGVATFGATTINAFTLAGTIAGGGNQINNIIVGNTSPLAGNFTTLGASGVTSVTNATASTTSSNGALVVTGGAGIGGALNVGGAINGVSYALSGTTFTDGWTLTTPTVTGRGTPGAFAATCQVYAKQVGKSTFIRIHVNVSNAGTATGFTITTPFTSNNTNGRGPIVVGTDTTTNSLSIMQALGSSTTLFLWNINGTELTPIATDYYFSGLYEAA